MQRFLHFIWGMVFTIIAVSGYLLVGLWFPMYESIAGAFIILILIFIAGGYIYSSLRRCQNEDCYHKLQDYMNEKMNTIPELRGKLRTIRLLISDENIFQGIAIPPFFIILSVPWYYAASVHNKTMDLAKSTICHELYHMSVHCTPLFPYAKFFIALRIKKLRDKHCIISWHEEFWADRKGCEWFGDKEVFLEKMKAMDSLYPEKKKFSTHPTWKMRINFLENDIEPTYDVVKEVYENYYYLHDSSK